MGSPKTGLNPINIGTWAVGVVGAGEVHPRCATVYILPYNIHFYNIVG